MAARKTIFSRYKMLPLLLAGLLFLAVFIIICLLGWSLFAYLNQAEISTYNVVPASIYLCAIFLAAALMTALIRGGTVFPAAVLSLLAAAATFALSDPQSLTIGGVVLKTGLSLAAGVIGFTVTKAMFMMRQIKAARADAKKIEEAEDEDDIDATSTISSTVTSNE